MIKERFEKIGYDVKMQVLNAADYGVPQKRERVIFIGGYEGLPVNFPDQTYRKKTNGTEDMFKSNLLDWITVREAIDDIKDHPEDVDFNHIFTKCGKEFLNKIRIISRKSSILFRKPLMFCGHNIIQGTYF